MAAYYEWIYNDTYFDLLIQDDDGEIVDLFLPEEHYDEDYGTLPVRGLLGYSVGTGQAANIRTIKIPSSYVSVAVEDLSASGVHIYYDGLSTFLQCATAIDFYQNATGEYAVHFDFEEAENTQHEIELPALFTEIRYGMFENIANITSVKGENVETVQPSAFYHCSALQSVYLPAVEAIGEQSFGYCGNLTFIALCDDMTVSQQRLSTVYLEWFTKQSGDSDLTYPSQTRVILPSGAASVKETSDPYTQLQTSKTARLQFYSGRSTGSWLEIDIDTEWVAMPQPTIYYGHSQESAKDGEWYFVDTPDDIVVAIKGDEGIVLRVSFTLPLKDTEQGSLGKVFDPIARYQTNKYYLAGSFDYMIRGSIGSSDTQPIKGNIMHLRSFEIKYFDDSIHIDHDDLVVIDGRLYGVEELAYDIKRSPKPYTVYFATLNNIK